MSSRLPLPLACALAAASSACGASNSFDGAIDGKKLTVRSAAFALLDGSVGDAGAAGGSGQVGLVVLSDSKSVCDDAAAGKLTHGQTYFALTLARLDVATQALVAPAAGTYAAVAAAGDASDVSGSAAALAAGGVAAGYFLAGDASCTNTLAADASGVQSGTVTVAALSAKSGGSARGEFSLKVGTQNSQVSGSFDAPYCAALGQLSPALLQSTAPPCR